MQRDPLFSFVDSLYEFLPRAIWAPPAGFSYEFGREGGRGDGIRSAAEEGRMQGWGTSMR